MILAFSTSSAWASVAAIDQANGVLWRDSKFAPQGASGACLEMLKRMQEESDLRVAETEMFVSDIGPGSFTGVRVGVTLAKTFAWIHDKPVSGATSFDLVSADSTVVLPSKKGEFFVRRPGEAPLRTIDLPFEPYIGFGAGVEPQTWPDASRFWEILDRLVNVSATDFCPEYLIEPSISVPKNPFRQTSASKHPFGEADHG